jgi:uncharacterized Zn-binding protein involved in type VI secretion
MPPAARILDMHTCPLVNPGPVPHVGGPIVKGQPNVLIGFMPAARITDMCVCVGPPDMIAKGSTGVLIGFLPAARMGDNTVHGGVIVSGFPTVMIGETGSGSAKGKGGKGSKKKGRKGKAGKQGKGLADAARAGTPFCEICN